MRDKRKGRKKEAPSLWIMILAKPQRNIRTRAGPRIDLFCWNQSPFYFVFKEYVQVSIRCVTCARMASCKDWLNSIFKVVWWLNQSRGARRILIGPSYTDGCNSDQPSDDTPNLRGACVSVSVCAASSTFTGTLQGNKRAASERRPAGLREQHLEQICGSNLQPNAPCMFS